MPLDDTIVTQDKTLRLLITADNFLSDETRWCQRRAKDDESYCMMGAIALAAGASPQEIDLAICHTAKGVQKMTYRAARYLERFTGGMTVHDFNDTHTFAEVKAILARAITSRAAEKMGQ